MIERCLAGVSRETRATLEACLEGRRLACEDTLALWCARGTDLTALVAVADRMRREQAGDAVSYVVNRNVNFTNVCVMACKFCAFSRTHRSEEGYHLDTEEIVRRALEAQAMGASEVCIQAGLAPGAQGRLYVDLVRAIKTAAPALHVHAWSPEEVKYGASLSGVPFRAYLEELADAGLGSLPGTSAEILDDAVRKRIAGGRITTAEWIEVVTTAHRIGLRTTATIMYGHVESDLDRARHLDLLRSIQEDTGGFTEFVPLSFVHSEAPLFLKRMLPDVRPGPTGDEVVRMIAIARLVLGPSFRNIQTSWVKEGLRFAQVLLGAGANDLGGTLMNESISTSAGAPHGQLVTPARLRAVIRDAGRTPVERTTLYAVRRVFSTDGADDPREPLDAVDDAEATFGSYRGLTTRARERARERARASKGGSRTLT